MDLRKHIRSAVMEEIGNTNLISLYVGNSPNHQILRSLIDAGVISNKDIETGLKPVVFAYARRDFQYLTDPKFKGDRYPDHVGNNETFAYGLNNGLFTEEEIQQISFDHGQDPRSYVERYHHKNLLSELREKLLNPVPLLFPGIDTPRRSSCSDPGHW